MFCRSTYLGNTAFQKSDVHEIDELAFRLAAVRSHSSLLKNMLRLRRKLSASLWHKTNTLHPMRIQIKPLWLWEHSYTHYRRKILRIVRLKAWNAMWCSTVPSGGWNGHRDTPMEANHHWIAAVIIVNVCLYYLINEQFVNIDAPTSPWKSFNVPTFNLNGIWTLKEDLW